MTQQTINIKGMTCGHCEGRVTAELLKIVGVTSVVASAEKATTVIETSSDIAPDLVASALREAGYSVNK